MSTERKTNLRSVLELVTPRSQCTHEPMYNGARDLLDLVGGYNMYKITF